MESIRSSKITTLFDAVAPTSSSPARIASSDAAGIVLRNTSTPRRNVRCSSTIAAVASVGIPSKNSSVPRRVATRSGVMIFAGIGVLKFGVFGAMIAPRFDELATFAPPSQGSLHTVKRMSHRPRTRLGSSPSTGDASARPCVTSISQVGEPIRLVGHHPLRRPSESSIETGNVMGDDFQERARRAA